MLGGALLVGCGGARTVSVQRFVAGSPGDPTCYTAECDQHPSNSASEVLAPQCFVEGADGQRQEIPCRYGRSTRVAIASPSALVVRARWQPEYRAALPEGGVVYVEARLGESHRRRMYVRPGAPIRPFRSRGFQTNLRPSNWAEATPPPNTVVEFVRPWPSAEGSCDLALVRVVDAGGSEYDGQWAFAQLSDLAGEPHGGPSAQEVVADERRAEEEAQQASVRAAGDEEIASGTCSSTNRHVLDEILSTTTRVFESLPGRRVAHEYVIAQESGVAVSFQPVLSGTYHIIAVGRGPVALTGQDRTGNPLREPSEYEIAVPSLEWLLPRETASLRVMANSFDQSTLRVSGHGCTLVAVFERL
jgi:hypothetical protein